MMSLFTGGVGLNQGGTSRVTNTYDVIIYVPVCAGQEKQIEVLDREVSQDEEQGEGAEEGVMEEEEEEEEGGEKGEEPKLETQESKEEEMTLFKPKMKEFPGTATVKGLRIRAEPSFMVSCMYIESHLRQLIFLTKSDCLGCAVLLCLVCLTLLASFFLPSHLSLKHV